MTRPVILISTDAVGGVWTYSLAIARGFAASGWNVVLAVVGPAPDAARQDAADGVASCTTVQTGLALDWLAGTEAELTQIAAGLCALAERLGAQAAHLHAPCLANADWRIPVVAVVHSCKASWWHAMEQADLPETFQWHRHASARGLLQAQAVIAPSQSFAEAVRHVYATDAAIHVVRNGTAKCPGAPTDRQDFVLTAGRVWDEGKNMITLDRAARRMRSAIRAAGPVRGPHGAGSNTESLELLGTLPDTFLRLLMARAAVFAAPSRYEPFGLAVLEAADLGTPLVLADIATFRELWDGAAIFVPATDEAAWADALEEVVADADLQAELGQAAKARATRYSDAIMVKATLDVHHRTSPALLQAA